MSSAAMETEPDDGATVANHQSGADEGQGKDTPAYEFAVQWSICIKDQGYICTCKASSKTIVGLKWLYNNY